MLTKLSVRVSKMCEMGPGTVRHAIVSVIQINLNKIQGPHLFFFILLVMLGNYEATCIVTIKMVYNVNHGQWFL